ncbi:unnamed protein product [Linum tenue]|uniref:Uncharacterized protein n=1 Tax=Linum tenue TaxID=586396 RepID=A0AAV0HZC1_9ROSI|nr:unnamed protein product [Linum tenue]
MASSSDMEETDQKSNYPGVEEKGVTWWPRVLTEVKGSIARQVGRGDLGSREAKDRKKPDLGR